MYVDRFERRRSGLRPSSAGGRGATVAIAVAAVGAAAWLAGGGWPTGAPTTDPDVSKRIVPRAELPIVEPARFAPVAAQTAREVNAAVAFSTEPSPAARPFRFVGSAEDLARATDCLAAAVIYEAGDDPPGERAVAQVVLNRLRHPAFPKTVCGVVFQGHERSTGCQFTFTCDGAMTRAVSAGGWARARVIAAMALNGSVHRPVGLATHYHTDWVVPYWSSSLDKIASVGTHLFFRWSGWWGTPPAFNRRPDVGEPSVGKLASLSEAHRSSRSVIGFGSTIGPAIGDRSRTVMEIPSQPDAFIIAIPAGTAPDRWPSLATQACGQRPYCKVWAWADSANAPSGLPFTTAQIQTLSFSFFRDQADAYEKALWNCGQAKRADARQCMKRQTPLPMTLSRSRSASDPSRSDNSRDANGARPHRPDPDETPSPTDAPHSQGTGTSSFRQLSRSTGVQDAPTRFSTGVRARLG